jgi:hypothetical protein
MASLLAACLALFAVSAAERPLIGINYFSGWWRGEGDKWFEPWNATVDWRPKYPERVPLLGQYNSQSTMDLEINAASTAGVDFFQILWYNPYPERAPGARFLNQGVTEFMASPNAHKMSFFIEWCIALPLFGTHNDSEWDLMIKDNWLPAFRHSSYLRVDNRLVFKAISGPAVMQNCSLNKDLVQARWDRLRDLVRADGLGEMIIGCGSVISDLTNPAAWWGYEYDWKGTYAGVANDNPSFTGTVLPWVNESSYIRHWRREEAYSASNISAKANLTYTYMPMLMSGWDPRPWRERRASYVFPTAAEWISDLQTMAIDLKELPATGLPRRDGTIQSCFNIYAWNEFAEGGIMAPSVGWNTTRLDALRRVFPRA